MNERTYAWLKRSSTHRPSPGEAARPRLYVLSDMCLVCDASADRWTLQVLYPEKQIRKDSMVSTSGVWNIKIWELVLQSGGRHSA